MDKAEAKSPGIETLRKNFEDYLTAKDGEIREGLNAKRYESGRQYTDEQLAQLKERGQPPIVFNRTARKVHGLVGTILRLRTDPKAVPRLPRHDGMAEIATHVIRNVCDQSQFERLEGDALLAAAIYGFAVVEMTLDGDEIGLVHVDPRSFFYDPASVKPDFSDARYVGSTKWVQLEDLKARYPGVNFSEDSANFFSTRHEDALESKWLDTRGRVRVADQWYKKGSRWLYCVHTASVILEEGESPFADDFGASICKFRPFSAFIDDEGDRYGFCRDLKGPQDAINQHRSKAVHMMNARQVIMRRGAGDAKEIQRQLMRANGVVELDGDPADVRIESPSQEILQQSNYYQDAKAEIENFGPNPALIGTGVNAKSGRAYAMLQQSALAELGPFLTNYRMWKLGIYRAIWAAAKRLWTSERWLRVTDDQGLAQFIQVNALNIDETGQPVIVNALGSADMEIMLEEGPDTQNVMGDAFDAMAALAQNGVAVPPQVLIEMSTLPHSAKEKLLGLLQPGPEAGQAAELRMSQEQAKTEEMMAKARKAASEAEKNETETAITRASYTAPMAYADPYANPYGV